MEYTEWNALVHEQYQQAGGDYPGMEVVTILTEAAARYWQDHKERLKRLAKREAVELAKELLRSLVERGVLDAR